MLPSLLSAVEAQEVVEEHTTRDVGLGRWPLYLLFIMRGYMFLYIET
jgi:hypothetical protein